MPIWTTADLISRVKVRGMFPTTDNRFSEANLLGLADEALESDITPIFVQAKRGFWERVETQTLTAGYGMYRLPYRAVLASAMTLSVLDGDTEGKPLNEVSVEQAYQWGTSTGMPTAFFTQGEDIVLLPTPSSALTLKIRYVLRRPKLIPTSEAAQITVVGAATSTIDFDVATLPATMVTGTIVDFIRAKSYFDHWAIDQVMTKVDADTLRFTASTLAKNGAYPAVGDWIALADESPIVPLPAEAHRLLVSATLFRALTSVKDPAAQFELAVLERDKKQLVERLAQRHGAEQRLVNRFSPLRKGRR